MPDKFRGIIINFLIFKIQQMKKISLFLWGAVVLVTFAIQSCNKESAKTVAGKTSRKPLALR